MNGAFARGGSPTNFIARAEAEFQRAQKQFQSDTNNFASAWQFGRACFDLADSMENNDRHADIARQGIAASRLAVSARPKSVEGHYYLAMDLGALAETETFGALKLVKEMEREFKTAVGLDEKFDFAGPDRNLGLLYRDAPGWPASIGSKRKAREYLERAEKIAPDYPENILNLAESCLNWGDPKRARSELDALDSLWPQAQKKFSGEKWEKDWNDWTKRREAAQQKLDEKR
ncbi:MAG TPA: hypothetical protein VFV23_10620 [Verrucomicrobiae bacterium]|nr:hypothetical protein [Verrucomicrobiae bacterium]